MMYVLEHVSKTLSGRKVLKDINLSIRAGESIALIGSNGSGKTMLIRMLAGLIHPDSGGQLSYKNQRLGKDLEFPERMGLIIETPVFWKDLSGRDNLLLIADMKKEAGADVIDHWLDFYGLTGEAEVPVAKYSLGMVQKLGLIQAFMEEPDLLLLDEPFNSLDRHSAAKTQEYLNEFKCKGGTLVMASHHRDDFGNLPDRTIEMEEGEIIAEEVSHERG